VLALPVFDPGPLAWGRRSITNYANCGSCVSVEQCHARIGPNNATRLSGKRVALLRGESVSVVTVGAVPAPTGDPPMRVYIIGNDGITLCREAPAAVNEGEIVVGSNEELRRLRIFGQQDKLKADRSKGA
jgi:hypothetical protein